MGDLGDYWRDVKAHFGQEMAGTRRAREEHATKKLKRLGVQFEEKNNGHHLILKTADGRIIDYWPARGRWIGRDGIGEGRGIGSLLKLIGK